MAHIRPFSAIRYARRENLDFSQVIAPPYDVLDERDKANLQERHPHNIVTIDLPHMPPKVAGPETVYRKSAATLQAWLNSGVLVQDPSPGIYPYAQTYTHGGRTFHRRGLIALVRLSPFGAGEVVPHEKTHKGPIEDRLQLMRHTGVQLSPIFGLYSDPQNQIVNLLYKNAGRAELSGVLDGVRNDLWRVTDATIENQVIDLMRERPIYIADGHHRYTTALQYQAELLQQHDGSLPENHPANWCMFVLVGMQDDGLLILPTHRLVGGLEAFDAETFARAIQPHAEMVEAPFRPDQINEFANEYLRKAAPHSFGLLDGRTNKLHLMRLRNPDVLKDFEPQHSPAWRQLDVAILQRWLLDEVLKPRFAGGRELSVGYSADAQALVPQVEGGQYQIGLLLQPTPLNALEELGRHNEVMPQKSTYFFPKLATGMAINPLRP